MSYSEFQIFTSLNNSLFFKISVFSLSYKVNMLEYTGELNEMNIR